MTKFIFKFFSSSLTKSTVFPPGSARIYLLNTVNANVSISPKLFPCKSKAKRLKSQSNSKEYFLETVPAKLKSPVYLALVVAI